MIPSGLGHAMTVWLLRNSAGAAVIAMLVLLVQWMLGRRISARWRHNLWLLVIVRLVLPPPAAVTLPAIPHLALLRPLMKHFHERAAVAPHTEPFVLPPTINPESLFFPSRDSESHPVVPLPSPITTSGDSVEAFVAHPALFKPAPPSERREAQASPVTSQIGTPRSVGNSRVARLHHNSPARTATTISERATQHSGPVPWARIVAFIWASVALSLLLKLLVGSLRIGWGVRKLHRVRDPALLELLQDCCRLLDLSTAPVLLEGPRESGPALVGFWRPKLLLPRCVTAQFTWREVRHVILHELIHLKRRDVLVNYLTSMVQAIHWFNPLVWLAAARMRAERELACDEAVLAHAPWREGRAYGSTIVKLLELLSRGTVPAGAMGVIGHRALMHRRIAMIARFDGSRRQWSVSGLLLSAALTGAALAGAVKAQVQPAPQPAAAQTATEPKEQTTSESNAATAVRQEADHAEEPSATSPETNAPQQTPGAGTPVPAAEHAAGLSVTTEPPAGIGAPTPTDHSVPQLPVYGPGRGGLGTAVGGFGGGGAAPGPVGAMMARGGGSGGGPMPPSQPQFATIEDAAAVKADAKTVEKLQRPMPIQVQGDSFEEVLNMLAQKGGFDVLIDNRALGELNLVPQVQMNIREPQPIEQLLHFVLRQVGGDEVGFSVVHGVVLVSSKAELDRHVVTRVYDIRELGNPDDMQQTIEQTIGGNVGVRFINGKMIVTTSEPSHREVAKLLTLLRQDGPHVDATGAAPAPGQPTTVTGAGELTVYQLHHADAQDTAKTIQSKLARPGLSISSDARTNSVVIAGPKGEVEAAGALIRSIDGGSVKTEPSSDLTSPPAANR